jgi:hypothetical protein
MLCSKGLVTHVAGKTDALPDGSAGARKAALPAVAALSGSCPRGHRCSSYAAAVEISQNPGALLLDTTV